MVERGQMEAYRVPAGAAVDLARHDPADRSAFAGGKAEARRHLDELRRRLEAAQELLWADGRWSLLIVLQAMDTGGKDGTIRNIFTGVNPQGVQVHGFGVPSELERARDFLWRVHQRVPGDGEIAVFNRSHYEDVLVVRVEGLAPEQVWRRRFDHIVAFENMLVDEGTTVLKFMLNISKDEQAARLQSRIHDPAKHWKFNLSDLEHRSRWGDYMDAYAEAIARTSTAAAPWYVVPANRKWYRDVVVATVIVETLEAMDLRYPEPPEGIEGLVVV